MLNPLNLSILFGKGFNCQDWCRSGFYWFLVWSKKFFSWSFETIERIWIMSAAPVVSSEPVEDLLLPLLERLEKKDFDLPPLPQVANQVLALTTDPQAHAAKLTGLIQQDPVLTSKIFQNWSSRGLLSQTPTYKSQPEFTDFT